MSSVFRPRPAKVDDKVAVQQHLDQTTIVLRHLSGVSAASEDHTAVVDPDIKAALDALGAKINAILGL